MSSFYRLAVIGLTSIATSVFAQQTPPDKALLSSKNAAPTHNSVVSTHKNFEDAALTDWTQANQQVHERGGRRAYLKEEQANNASAKVSTTPDPHAAHRVPTGKEK